MNLKRDIDRLGDCCIIDFLKFKRASVVYGIGDKRTGRVLYVGRTKNIYHRWGCYCHGASHNRRLRHWLNNHLEDAYVVVLQRDGDIVAAEKRLINANKNRLWNVINGIEAEKKWQSSFEVKPWKASTGVTCPSTMLMRHYMPVELRRRFVRMRDDMTDFGRALYEVNIARTFYKAEWMKRAIDHWLYYCRDRLVAVLEQELPK